MSKRLNFQPLPRRRGTKILETHDSADYVDWTKAQRVVLPNLKPTTNPFRCGFPNTCSRHQGRGQRARRAVSVVDQDLVAGAG